MLNWKVQDFKLVKRRLFSVPLLRGCAK